MKKRKNKFINNGVKLKNRGFHSDSFENHFDRYFKGRDIIRAKDVREIIEIRINKEIQLCMEERIQFAKAKLFKSSNVMNKNMEIFRACRHKAKIHHYEKQEYQTGLKTCVSHKKENRIK